MTDKKVEPPKPAAAPRATASAYVPDKTVEGPKNAVVRENDSHPDEIVIGPAIPLPEGLFDDDKK